MLIAAIVSISENKQKIKKLTNNGSGKSFKEILEKEIRKITLERG